MKIKNKDLKRRIIEISHKHKLSHLGSCLTAVDIIKDIYDVKKPHEKFVLSQGHAGLALYVMLERMIPGQDAEDYLGQAGIHPDRKIRPTPPSYDPTQRYGFYVSPIDCSTGSLGQGLPIALGMALADRTKNVYCLISDGELAEGSIMEAFRIKQDLSIDNLKIFVNCNGYGGYTKVDQPYNLFGTDYDNPGLFEFQARMCDTNVDYLPFLEGLKGHYHTMSEDDYNLAMEILK